MFKVGDKARFKNSKRNIDELSLESGLIGNIIEIIGMRGTADKSAEYLFDCILMPNRNIIGEYYDYRFERIKPTLNKQIQVL